MTGSIPATNLYGMIGDIGDTIANGLKEANKQRLLSARSARTFRAGTMIPCAQRAFQGGDIGVGMSLLAGSPDSRTTQTFSRRLRRSNRRAAAVASAPATGDTSVPRGLRNNNPGNIEDGPFAKSMPAMPARTADLRASPAGQWRERSIRASRQARPAGHQHRGRRRR